MRVISQDRMTDFPYDSSLITAFEGDEVWVLQAVNMNRVFFIGAFESKKDAFTEMERIRLKYAEGMKVYKITNYEKSKKAIAF